MKMLDVGFVAAFALAVSAIIMALVLWPAVAVVPTACAGACVGLVVAAPGVLRERKVRRLITAALDADVAHLDANQVAYLLNTPDVLAALGAYQRREAQMLATRYANGDASDF